MLRRVRQQAFCALTSGSRSNAPTCLKNTNLMTILSKLLMTFLSKLLMTFLSKLLMTFLSNVIIARAGILSWRRSGSCHSCSEIYGCHYVLLFTGGVQSIPRHLHPEWLTMGKSYFTVPLPDEQDFPGPQNWLVVITSIKKDDAEYLPTLEKNCWKNSTSGLQRLLDLCIPGRERSGYFYKKSKH